MSKYLYDKAILSPCMETIRHYYPKMELCLFSVENNAATYRGYEWQFEISEDYIKFYENSPTGQDMPRRKGFLLFSVRMNDIRFFERTCPSGIEFDLYGKLLDLNLEYLRNKIDKQQYGIKKDSIFKLFEENKMMIDKAKFEMPHEWNVIASQPSK